VLRFEYEYMANDSVPMRGWSLRWKSYVQVHCSAAGIDSEYRPRADSISGVSSETHRSSSSVDRVSFSVLMQVRKTL